MALKGTLKDFGIADIFQLISHQSKTGVLHLQTKDQEVRISFASGDVVRAESTTRKQKDLLGAMLVRAEVLSKAQLDQALGIQKRTLKRLGDILIDQGFISRDDLKQFTRLQTTETLYKLFSWETGTYAFETEEVSYDQDTVDPIRSENILMEGFRMVDEWPMVRKRVSSYEMTFEKVKELTSGPAPGGDDSGAAGDEIDDAFDEMFVEEPKPKAERPKNIGSNEENVFGLISADRDVQKLIDLSRLGEFETCKALLNLLNEGFIKVDKQETAKPKEKPGVRRRRFPLARVLVQVGMYIFLVGLLLVLYHAFELDPASLFQESSTRTFQDPAARELLHRNQQRRVYAALDLYRLENGRYPDALDALVEAGLLAEGDLRYPWRRPRVYRQDGGRVLVLRPFE